jgi:cytoskeletal protein CcmA (bactofilin family)
MIPSLSSRDLINPDLTRQLAEIDSLVALGDELTGDFSSHAGGLRVDGRFVGDIQCAGGAVWITPLGVVEGNITATYVRIDGTLIGTLVCDRELHLSNTATVRGAITYRGEMLVESKADLVANVECERAEASVRPPTAIA